MAITTALQTRFTVQKIFVIGICLVFGLWGVYDHQVKIPAKQRAFERGELCRQVRDALRTEPVSDEARQLIPAAQQAIQTELQVLFAVNTAGLPPGDIQPAEAVAAIKAASEEKWFQVLMLFAAGLTEAERRIPGGEPKPAFIAAVAAADGVVDEIGEVSAPGNFDRATQWLFILCLPFVPWFVFTFFKARNRVYRLDDDGTLHTPEGSWPREEITDIDMSRWMAKSTATVAVKHDGRIKLDDYVYRNTNLIVGALASEMYPDEWDAEGKQIKDEETEGSGDEDAGVESPEHDEAREEVS